MDMDNWEGYKIRRLLVDGNPWWVATDVCKALEIKNSRQAVSRLDGDEKGVTLNDTLGGRQETNIVNEPGLYTLISASRSPRVRLFKRWVFHEVLPAIRKTGTYTRIPLVMSPLLSHMNPDNQREHSKAVSGYKMERGGVPAIVDHHIKNSMAHDRKNRTPMQIKRDAVGKGYPSKIAKNSREITRLEDPAVACVMSSADELVAQGMPIESFLDVTTGSLRDAFDGLIRLGVLPGELKKLDKPVAKKRNTKQQFVLRRKRLVKAP